MTAWKIVETSEYLVTQPLVEREGLEVKCIQHGVMASALRRLTFREEEELPSETTPPECLSYPDLLDLEPAPHGVRNEAGHYVGARLSNHDYQRRVVPWRDSALQRVIDESLLHGCQVTLASRGVHCGDKVVR